MGGMEMRQSIATLFERVELRSFYFILIFKCWITSFDADLLWFPDCVYK